MTSRKSLPPHVCGSCQGHLHVELLRFEMCNSPDLPCPLVLGGAAAVLEWWGGDHHSLTAPLVPRNLAECGDHSVEVLAVRCSPASFSAYLRDMSVLRIRLRTKPCQGNLAIGVCEVSLIPFVRGADHDYTLRLSGCYPVSRGGGDRTLVGKLEVELWTEWARHAQLRPQAEVLSSFEFNEKRACTDSTLSLVPNPKSAQAVTGQVPLSVGEANVPSSEVVAGQSGEARIALEAGSATKDVHVRLRLGEIRLRTDSLRNVRAVFKLGATQEVSAWIADKSSGVWQGGFLHGSIDSCAISAAAVWFADLGHGVVQGPMPAVCHVHIWRGRGPSAELLGLARVRLPELELLRVHEICHSGHLCLTDQNVNICAVTSGAGLGVVRVALDVGTASALAQAPLMPGVAGPPEGLKPDTLRGHALCEAPIVQHHRIVHQAPEKEEEEGVEVASVVEVGRGSHVLTPGELRLVSSRVSPEQILEACNAQFCSQRQEYVQVADFQAALLHCVGGLTAQEASSLSAKAAEFNKPVSNMSRVRQPLWDVVQDMKCLTTATILLFLNETTTHVECCIDSFVSNVGDACGLVASDLQCLGPHEVLTRKEFVGLLEARNVMVQPETLASVFVTPQVEFAGGIPASPLAHLFARRAEVWWREVGLAHVGSLTFRSVSSDISDTEAEVEAEVQAELVLPMHLSARQLLCAFRCLLIAGAVSIAEAARILDASAVAASGQRPHLWCGVGQPPTFACLARIVDTDSAGLATVVSAWKAVGLRTSATAAAAALLSLADVSSSSTLRIRESSLRGLCSRSSSATSVSDISTLDSARGSMEASTRRTLTLAELGGVAWLACDVRRRLFEALLSAGVGPEQLPSLLTQHAMSLSMFATSLVEAGLPLSRADLALAGRTWASDGFLNIHRLATEYSLWSWQRLGESLNRVSDSRLRRADCLFPWLPAFIVFALLNVYSDGQITMSLLRCFAVRCWGASRDAVDAFDGDDANPIAYGAFRRWYQSGCGVGHEAAGRGASHPATAVLEQAKVLHVAVQALVLRLGPAPRDKVADLLQQRGRFPEEAPDVGGLAELLQDLHLSSGPAAALVTGSSALADVAGRQPTYEALAEALGRAHELLQQHLDGLLGACLAVGLDSLEAALAPALRSPALGAFTGSIAPLLRAAGADLSAVDVEEMTLLLGTDGRSQAEELVSRYRAFRAKRGALLEELADSLGHGQSVLGERLGRIASALRERRCAAEPAA